MATVARCFVPTDGLGRLGACPEQVADLQENRVIGAADPQCRISATGVSRGLVKQSGGGEIPELNQLVGASQEF